MADRDEQGDDLAAPAVAPEEYDTEYYLNWCGGYEEWAKSGGSEYSVLYPGSLRRADFREGEVLVDIGTGRGELLAAAVEQGAARAIGIEYSPDAVELAERTIERREVGERAEVILADARRVPVADGTADLVTLLDVVEHLVPAELDGALREALRILRPGGRIVIHTFPSRTLYEVTYRLQRLSRPSRWRRWPKDPRVELERTMHVNEQTLPSLRRALIEAGFPGPEVSTGEWIYATFVPEEDVAGVERTYRRLASRRLTARFGSADIWASARKPG